MDKLKKAIKTYLIEVYSSRYGEHVTILSFFVVVCCFARNYILGPRTKDFLAFFSILYCLSLFKKGTPLSTSVNILIGVDTIINSQTVTENDTYYYETFYDTVIVKLN